MERNDLDRAGKEPSGQGAREPGEFSLAAERLRLATEAGLIGIWDWDIEHDRLVWDASMYRLYGRREGDFGGAYEAWIRAVHPEDKAHADAEIQAALRGEREYAPEFRVVWPDGSVHHIKAASQTLRDGAGKPVRMVGINYDLTERKHAEEERLAHLRLLEGMDRVNRAIAGAKDLEQMTSGVLDVLLAILGCDRAYLLHPCDPEAPSWRVPAERILPQYPGAGEQRLDVPMDPEVAGKMRLLLAAGGPVSFGAGSTRPVPPTLAERFQIKAILAMAVHPKVGKAWELGVHRCAEDRPWTAEEQRLFLEAGQRLTDALATFLIHADLRDSEDKLARAERIVHVGYVDRDLVEGRVTLSDEACRILGLSQAQRVLGLEQWQGAFEQLIHPEDRVRVLRALGRAIEASPHYELEYRVVRGGGEVRHVHSQGDVTRDEAGRPRRVLGTVLDVTARKQAEEEIRELNQNLERRVAERTAELEATNRELEAFAYSVSHDLRAPLRAIDGFRGLLQQRTAGLLDEQGERYLRSISDAATRMGRLVDDLLSFSRMGRLEMARQQVDLAALARDVVSDQVLDPPDRRVEWRTGALPVVVGDRAMLRLVLANLLSNALKFTRTRERAEIEVGCERRERSVVVFVRDNGVGFDMAYVDKLFGVFQRLHRVEEYEGTGIGLANVRRIVARHGGRTWAEGALDRGATFFFSLPI